MFLLSHHTKAFTIAIFGLGFLSGCAKHKSRPLLEPIGITKESQRVSVCTSLLSDADCSYYFGKKVTHRGFVPLQLNIQNTSNQTYILDGHNIHLQLEDRMYMAQQLHFNTAQRVVAWAIPGLFLWPFFIPAIMEGISSNNANKKLDSDFHQRVIDSNSYLVIPPYSSVNKLLFVQRENYTSKFILTLKNKTTNQALSFKLECNRA